MWTYVNSEISRDLMLFQVEALRPGSVDPQLSPSS
jgi:hypothetical protein